jgi:hypothetical protein
LPVVIGSLFLPETFSAIGLYAPSLN